MPNKVKPMPEGSHTVTAGLCQKDSKAAIEFYKKAFGATEKVPPFIDPRSGKVMHAELKIGDSTIYLADEFPDMPGSNRAPQTLKGTTASLFLYVPDVDRAFEQAVKAGAKSGMKPADMFWGDRFAQVVDPFGHIWSLSTHIKDQSEAETKKAAEEFFAHAVGK